MFTSILRNLNPPIRLRGIVEGFYGIPYTFEDRVELITFCGKNRLNAYIYGPKNDTYHRDNWREPYPKDKLAEFQNTILISKKNKVKFIFAISPGIDINFVGEQANKDFNYLMEKIDSIYKIGCRDFAIFFDDIKIKDGLNQAIFLNKVSRLLKKKYFNINRLITVPTDYALLYMINSQDKMNKYTSDFVNNLDKNIIVLYTGDKVISDGICEKNYTKAFNIYKNNLGIWWNYPVNDFLGSKLALGPIEKLPNKNINYIFFNPMRQPMLSKITLATGADYSYNPKNYNPDKSWNNAIEKQFGKNAEAMKIFASHSRHMENRKKSQVGPPDAPEFYDISHQAVLDTKLNKNYNFSLIIELINETEKSADTLLNNLEPKILSECKLQLEQFKRIIKADRIAVKSLQEGKLDNDLKNLRKIIDDYKSQAIISEKSALKFIDEVIELFN